MTEEVKSALLRDVLLHNPALFYTSLTAPGKRPITPFRHQFQPLYHAMISRPVRILIADEIGLGKTVQALAIARYLELRGEAKRILVLVPKILRKQWKNEIRRVGGFPRVIKDGREVESTLRKTNGYTVVSIDLAKRSPHREKFLKVEWDLIIVDEVHNVTLGTQRYNFLKELLEKRKETLNVIFLSATPHRGDPKDYLARLALLDHTLIENYKKLDKPAFYRKTRDTLVLRRTKKVVNDLEGRDVFKKCHFGAVVVDISREERAFLDELDSVLAEMIKNKRENSPEALLAVLVRKRASSSYEAAIKTISKIAESANSRRSGKAERVSKYIKSLFGLGYDEIELEDFNEIDDAVERIIEEYSSFLDRKQINALRSLLGWAEQIKERDSKLNMVAEIAVYHVRKGEKVIIFTEFKDTLEYLKRKLPRIMAEKYGLKLHENEIAFLCGGMSSDQVEEQMKKFEEHGKLLISTDVASEGLNLQIASVVINYEAPWSPIKLEQRVGRIWRLSQPRETTAYTLFLAAEADLYVLQNLYQKIMNITEAIGSGPKLGKPVFGSQMFSADFERLWKEEVPTGTPEEGSASEYELVLASIKKELKGYAGVIVKTLRSLRQNIERLIPSDTAKQVHEELSFILTKDDLNHKLVSEVLREYVIKVLGKRSIPNISPILHGVVRDGDLLSQPLHIGVKGDSDTEYLYLVRVIDAESGKELHRYPVLVRREGGKLKFLYGISLLEHATKVLSGGFIVLGCPPSTVEQTLIASRLRTIARDRFYKIRAKYRDYDKAFCRGKLKSGSLFVDVRIDVVELIRIEGISEGQFNIMKHVPRGILEVYGLSEDEVEPPTDRYIHALERNFVPLEDIVKSEKEAMRIVMGLEKKRLEKKYGPNGDWKVENVSLKEHYDIKVVEPAGKKYIEVKGHKPLLLTAEVTPAEYEFAVQNKDRYWLYIVANLGKKKPVILKIFKPFEHGTHVYAVTGEGREVDITEKISWNVEKKTRRVLAIKP